MNKHTFIQTLRDGLRGMPQEDVEEIMSDFEDHFAMGQDQGKSEEDIAQHLGDPARIAAAYRGEGADGEPRDGRNEREHSRSSNERYVNIHDRFGAGEVRGIEISMLSSDITVSRAPGDEIIVDIEGNSRGGITSELSGGRLLICQEFRLFDFLVWLDHEPEVLIQIPASYRGALALKTKSGNIGAGDFEGESLQVNSMSGDVRLGVVKAQTLRLKTVSGEAEVRAIAGHTAQIGSVSGNVVLGDIRVYKLQLNNVSGDTRQSPGCAVETDIISQSSVSGDLQLRLTDKWRQIDANSVSGDLRLTMPEGERFSVELNSVSGRVDNQLGSDPRASRFIRAKTVSGDLKIERL